MVPDAGSAKSYDHYAYTLNNPIIFNDPTGHDVGDALLIQHLTQQGSSIEQSREQVLDSNGYSPSSQTAINQALKTYGYAPAFLPAAPTPARTLTATASLPKLTIQSIRLSVPQVKQLTGASCGESAITMAHNFTNPNNKVDQSTITSYATTLGLYTITPPFTTPKSMITLAKIYPGANGYKVGNAPNADAGLSILAQQLQNGNPIIIDVTLDFTPQNGGRNSHFILITGISSEQDEVAIYYNNPESGAAETHPWDKSFQNSWENNGDSTNDTPSGNGFWLSLQH